MNIQPPGVTDAELIVFSIVVALSFIAGVFFGLWLAHALADTEQDISGRLMTPPENDSQFPDEHEKPRRLKALQ